MRLLLSLIFTVLMTAAARAQGPMAIDFEAAFTPEYTVQDLPLFRSELLLDDEQSAIAESILQDHSEQFERVLRQVREDLRGAQAALGSEDPEIDRQREELRGQIAALMEEMQAALQNAGEGANVASIREKYDAEMRDLASQLQRLQSQPMKPAQMAKLFDDASVRLEQWRIERKRLSEKLAADMRAILREDQRQHWPALERRILRQNTLGRGRLQGEGVDLFLVVRDQKLDLAQSQAISQQLADYEASLDAALRRRNDLMDSSARGLFKAVAASDRQALAAAIGEITKARVAVRNVNDETAAALAATLGGEAGAKVTDSYRQRAYPLVYRETQTVRLMKAARELGGLTPVQVQSLDQLQSALEAELGPMNERVLAAVRQYEPEQLTLREVRLLLPPTPEMETTERDRGPDGVQQAFTKRTELGQKFDAQLQTILGEELYERLPRNDRLVRPAQKPDDN